MKSFTKNKPQEKRGRKLPAFINAVSSAQDMSNAQAVAALLINREGGEEKIVYVLIPAVSGNEVARISEALRDYYTSQSWEIYETWSVDPASVIAELIGEEVSAA